MKPKTNKQNDLAQKLDYQEQFDHQKTTLPGVNPVIPYGFTSEEAIRFKVMSVIVQSPRQLTKEQLYQVGLDSTPIPPKKTYSDEEKQKLAEKWIEKLVAMTKKRGRLMTTMQYSDWCMGRRFVVGDKAKYVGPDRNEVAQNELIVPRLTGQSGYIIGVSETKHEGRIITFQPNMPVEPLEAPGMEKQIVDLQVREYTTGWLCLEREPL